jgi:hypothetical protein
MFTSRKSTFLDIASNCKRSAMYMSFYSAAKFFIVVTLSLVVVNLSSFLLSSPLSNHCTGDRFIPFSSGQKQTILLPHWSIHSVSKASFSVNLPVRAYKGLLLSPLSLLLLPLPNLFSGTHYYWIYSPNPTSLSPLTASLSPTLSLELLIPASTLPPAIIHSS